MLATSMQAHIAPLSFLHFYMERVPKAGEGIINFIIVNLISPTRIRNARQGLANDCDLSWIIRASITFQ